MHPTMQREEEFSSEENLPVGFKFYPTDVELVDHYLHRRLRIGETHSFMPDLDVYAHAPWDLNIPPAIANNDDDESSIQRYYCFTCRHRTSEGSLRVNRKAGCGLWDFHGQDIVIRDPADYNKVIGHKVQLNFKVVDHEFNRKKKTKTSWIMHEYRLESEAFQELVLCMIYNKKRSSKEAGEMPRPAADQQSKRGRTTEVERGSAKRQRIENHPALSSTSSPDYDQESYAGETATAGELLLLEEAKRGPGDVDDDEFYDQVLAMEQGPAYANCSGSS